MHTKNPPVWMQGKSLPFKVLVAVQELLQVMHANREVQLLRGVQLVIILH